MSLAALAGIFLLTTGFDRQQIHPLTSVATEMLPSLALKEKRITVAANAMSGDQSKQAFGHDLPNRGIQPLQLTIQNNTPNKYSMCPSSIDLPKVSARKVANSVTKSSLARTIGYKIAGFFFWPFMIPGTIDSIRTMKHNKSIKKDVLAKSMKREIVAPYSTFNRVLFVPKEEFKKSFTVTLIDLDTLDAEEFEMNVDKTPVSIA